MIDRALEYNKDMLIAASRVKEMAAQKRISVANLLPQLTGKVEAEREVENYGGHSRDVGNTYEAKALLSWELDLWGNLRWKKVAAVAEYLQSVEAQRALRMTIVAEVAQAYYELVALDTELIPDQRSVHGPYRSDQHRRQPGSFPQLSDHGYFPWRYMVCRIFL